MDAIERFEERAARAAREFAYPPTPAFDLRLPARRPRRRLAIAALALAAVALALAAAPPVRARLYEILRLGGVRILFQPDAAPESTQLPFEAVDLLSGLNLTGRTTLAEAREAVDFGIPLPRTLGEPDAVYLQDLGTGPFVILAWPSADDPMRAGIVLYVLGPGTQLSKGPLDAIRHTEVNGRPAIWTEGFYLVDVQGERQPVRLVEGGALVWTLGELTLRLEGAGTLEAAVELAETVR
jgi:hypothetical protein